MADNGFDVQVQAVIGTTFLTIGGAVLNFIFKRHEDRVKTITDEIQIVKNDLTIRISALETRQNEQLDTVQSKFMIAEERIKNILQDLGSLSEIKTGSDSLEVAKIKKRVEELIVEVDEIRGDLAHARKVMPETPKKFDPEIIISMLKKITETLDKKVAQVDSKIGVTTDQVLKIYDIMRFKNVEDKKRDDKIKALFEIRAVNFNDRKKNGP